jgi:hypothetical protein
VHRERHVADPKTRRELFFARERDAQEEFGARAGEDRRVQLSRRTDVEIDEALGGDRVLKLLIEEGAFSVVDPKLEIDRAADRDIVLIGQERFERQLHRVNQRCEQEGRREEEQGCKTVHHGIDLS